MEAVAAEVEIKVVVVAVAAEGPPQADAASRAEANAAFPDRRLARRVQVAVIRGRPPRAAFLRGQRPNRRDPAPLGPAFSLDHVPTSPRSRELLARK